MKTTIILVSGLVACMACGVIIYLSTGIAVLVALIFIALLASAAFYCVMGLTPEREAEVLPQGVKCSCTEDYVEYYSQIS